MKNKIKEFLTKDEAQFVLKQPNQRTIEGLRDFCILSLMVYTGLRRAEICDLNRGSLKTSGKRINLHILGKGKKWRTVPVANLELIEALVEYFNKMGTMKKEDEPMFYKMRKTKKEKLEGITWATIRYLVEKYVKMAGIKKRITPHSLRHTFITLALQSGADLATIKNLAGHSNITTTSRYLHTTEELKEQAIDKLII